MQFCHFFNENVFRIKNRITHIKSLTAKNYQKMPFIILAHKSYFRGP